PSTFYAALVGYENDRHAARLAEIKKHEKRILMFQDTWRALRDRGMQVSLSWTLSAMPTNSLRITYGSFTSLDHRLHDALLELGYVEVSRSGDRYSDRILKKGRLSVSVTVEAAHEAPKAGAA
ncbi:MAG: hypothetical protein JWQ10_296, partial [Herbaspirillum sp.]|nr:hypothetical protein [Herbaspirillum sp.]